MYIKQEGFNMKKLFIAKGYNSYTNQELIKAFATEQEADKFLEGLTDPRINIVSYKSTVQLLNYYIKG
jgi:hypothetical protein